jgi:flagellar L-ring protein precursor FlgH
MKRIYLPLLLIALATLAIGTSAQDKNKKKKKGSEPKLTVVDIDADRATVPPAIAEQKPANGSLFTDSAVNGSLFQDFKARRSGDLVFVDVVEASSATVVSSAKRSRDSGTVGGLTNVAGALSVPGAAAVSSVIGALGQRKYDGNGQTQRDSEVRARITARVVEVLPNGDLKIEAMKLVKINKETELVAVTGIVRQTDLAADNSIPTTYIGDLRVEFNGKGVASADNAPGWLFRLFDKISPF